MTRANNAPWFTKAGAANGIMPISHFVGDSIFAIKSGGYTHADQSFQTEDIYRASVA
jgi:hypothetical protein